MRPTIVSSKIGEDSQSRLWMLECLDVLLISSHVYCLNSEEMFLGCLSDIGFGLWGLCLRDVEFD